MTIDEALAYGRAQLASSPTAALDARLLLQHVLQKPHAFLIARGGALLSPGQQKRYQALLQRAQQQEPIPYLTGTAPFFDFELEVTPAVLIPRPETEQLVETAVAWAKNSGVHRRARRWLDVGTGSGCIAIALARQLPAVTVTAVDISPQALQIARRNAGRLAPGRIEFHQSDLLDSWPPSQAGGPPLAGIIANLPYVTDAEWTALDDGVKWYEPSLALKGGPDGLVIIRRLLAQAASRLSPGGAIFLEIGWRQGTACTHLARSTFPAAAITLLPDFAGHERLVVIET